MKVPIAVAVACVLFASDVIAVAIAIVGLRWCSGCNYHCHAVVVRSRSGYSIVINYANTSAIKTIANTTSSIKTIANTNVLPSLHRLHALSPSVLPACTSPLFIRPRVHVDEGVFLADPRFS